MWTSKAGALLITPKYYSLFSGGKDSITLAHYLASRRELESVVFIDTGIKTPDILPHVEKVAKTYGWNLIVYRTPISYDEQVVKYGFPTAPAHRYIMSALKGRAIRSFHKEFPEGVLASGVRRGESKRRFRNTKREGVWEGVKIVAPLYDWTTPQVWEYIRKHNLPVSPAYATLHISGDCLCGAYAMREEMTILKMFYPEEYERLRRLEERCRVVGKCNPSRCKWEGYGTDSVKDSSLLCFECGVNA